MNIEAHFFSNVDFAGALECWEWSSASGKGRYGQFKIDGRVIQAHRWSYEHFVGEIPDGLVVDHLCRNKPCVNPWHLDPVTQQVNTQRGCVAMGPTKIQTLANAMYDRIVSGEFGDRLPTVKELRAGYGASHYLMCDVLDVLVSQGLLTRTGPMKSYVQTLGALAA